MYIAFWQHLDGVLCLGILNQKQEPELAYIPSFFTRLLVAVDTTHHNLKALLRSNVVVLASSLSPALPPTNSRHDAAVCIGSLPPPLK